MKLIFAKNFFQKISDQKISELQYQSYAYMEFHFESKKWLAVSASDPKSILEKEKTFNEFYEKKWVHLTQKKGQWVQQGPLSFFEIFEGLQDSTIQFTDAIWQSGFSKWMPIHKVKNFSCLKDLHQNPEDDATDLLANVIEMRRVEPKKTTQSIADNLFIILDEKNKDKPV